MVASLVSYLLQGKDGDWWIYLVFGSFVFFSAISRMVCLRNELTAMKEAEEAANREEETLALEAGEEEASEEE